MDRSRNETIRTTIGMKKDILQEIAEQQLTCMATSCDWRTVELLDGLQNWAEKEQGEAGQSTHERRELGTVCSKIKPQEGRMFRSRAMEEKVMF
jgi:hypothetical protein